MSDILSRVSSAVIKGDVEAVRSLIEQALAEGIPARQILDEGLISGMNVVGKAFKEGAVFVPEVLLSARAMQTGQRILKPQFAESESPLRGKVVLGTVKGDLHDIGKNLVGMMLEGADFEVIDLGKDVEPESFVKAVEEHQAEIVGLSALLTTTMVGMEKTIKALQSAGLRSCVKVLVGGAPVTREFANHIGADGYGSSATAAVDLARQFREA